MTPTALYRWTRFNVAPKLTVGDFRRARAVLAGKTEGERG